MNKQEASTILDKSDRINQELLRFIPPVAYPTARNKCFELRKELVKELDKLVNNSEHFECSN